VAKAEQENLALASLMARLDARGPWASFLIPAFIYFFQKLYPFPRANDPDDSLAAAAGGCMLARRDAVDAIGGMGAIRSALIDDCAFARAIKNLTPSTKIWIGLASDEAVSLRDNRELESIWNMVARTAYAQLGYSPLMLAGTVLGMALIYLAAPLIILTMFWHWNFAALFYAAGALALMAYTYWPTLRLYGRAPWEAALLPAAAALYTAMTISSALRHWRGEGGRWKGRTY
jgi:hopene-associated glycosyltransferase HpnB